MALTTNFTDPVKLSSTAPLQALIKTSHIPLRIELYTYKATQVMLPLDSGVAARPVMLLFEEMTPIRTTLSKLPKPPVGKLLVSTFPPIYKERNNYSGIADSPRIYPPIYTYRTS